MSTHSPYTCQSTRCGVNHQLEQAAARRAGSAMTGDDLVTALVQADSDDAALVIAATAPLCAIREATDLLYIDTSTSHRIRWYRRAVAREARA